MQTSRPFTQPDYQTQPIVHILPGFCQKTWPKPIFGSSHSAIVLSLRYWIVPWKPAVVVPWTSQSNTPCWHTYMLYFVYFVQTIILYYVLFHTCIYVFIAPLYVDRSWFSTYSKRACTHVHVSNMLQKILCWSLARVTTRTNRSHCGRQPLLHKLLAAGSVCVCVCACWFVGQLYRAMPGF